MGASCDEVPPDVAPSFAQPLPQESIVLVEIDVPSVGWVTMPLPQAGAERLGRLWCWHDRMKTTDSRLCRKATVGRCDPLDHLDPASVSNASLATCEAEVCRLRNEVCAGMLLEEAARSPLPRTLESSTVGGLSPSTTSFRSRIHRASRPLHRRRSVYDDSHDQDSLPAHAGAGPRRGTAWGAQSLPRSRVHRRSAHGIRQPSSRRDLRGSLRSSARRARTSDGPRRRRRRSNPDLGGRPLHVDHRRGQPVLWRALSHPWTRCGIPPRPA